MPKTDATTLGEFAQQLFIANSVIADDAIVVAEHLVDANLTGHDSHGVLRIPQYLEAVDSGQVQIQNRPQVISKSASGARINGQQCFGQVACVEGMKIAVELAQKTGVGAVTVSNSFHTGRIGAYSELATSQGMIGMVMVNAGGGGQSVTPFGGKSRRLATNPMSIAAPWEHGFPVVIDIATSVAPEGKIRLHKLQKKRIPTGWIVDGYGNPSTDPNDFYATPPGSILPLGGEAGHKGFGLSVMVDLLAGALSGGGVCTAEEVPPTDNVLMIAINIDQYAGAETFQNHIENLVHYLQNTPPAPGFDRVYAPGELEYLSRKRRAQEGIEIDDETWQALAALAEKSGMAFMEE